MPPSSPLDVAEQVKQELSRSANEGIHFPHADKTKLDDAKQEPRSKQNKSNRCGGLRPTAGLLDVVVVLQNKNKGMVITMEIWRYPRFFSTQIKENSACLSTEDTHHATQVLRMKRGDKAIVCDGKCRDYLCEYSENGKLSIINSQSSKAEPKIHLRLFQCLPKSDKMDYIVQKAVELGASEIIPVTSARCVSRLSAESAEKKIPRWNKIAYEAAKQCGRGKIPSVGEVLGFQKAVQMVKSENVGIIFYESGGEQLNDIIGNTATRFAQISRIDLLIGSEGGFEEEEIELAKARGIVPATMGKRILRVDTASVAAISVVMFLTKNW